MNIKSVLFFAALALPLSVTAGGMPPLNTTCQYSVTDYEKSCLSKRFQLSTGKGIMEDRTESGRQCPHGGKEVDFLQIGSISGEGLREVHATSTTTGEVLFLHRGNFRLTGVQFSANGKKVRITGVMVFPGGEIDGTRVVDTLTCREE